MTVEAYLRSLVIGLDLPDEVLERCARSPIEVGLEPLDLNEDIDAVRKPDEPAETPEDTGDEGGDNNSNDGNDRNDDDADNVDAGGNDGDDTDTDFGGDDGDDDGDVADGENDEEPFDKVTDFQMRLDYASSNIYYSVLGVFSGGGYSEQVGDVKVTRSSFVITMADRERFKRLGDMLRRKWGWDVDDEDENGIMDVSILRSVI